MGKSELERVKLEEGICEEDLRDRKTRWKTNRRQGGKHHWKVDRECSADAWRGAMKETPKDHTSVSNQEEKERRNDGLGGRGDNKGLVENNGEDYWTQQSRTSTWECGGMPVLVWVRLLSVCGAHCILGNILKAKNGTEELNMYQQNLSYLSSYNIFLDRLGWWAVLLAARHFLSHCLSCSFTAMPHTYFQWQVRWLLWLWNCDGHLWDILCWRRGCPLLVCDCGFIGNLYTHSYACVRARVCVCMNQAYIPSQGYLSQQSEPWRH